MGSRIRLVVLIALLLSLETSLPAKADISDGFAAYDRGDYTTAFRKLKPLAEQGDAAVQFILGFMYADGRGVPQDYAAAARWYRRAAEQGLAEGQYILGGMYADGRGVPQDDAEAVKWFRRAAEQGSAEAQSALGVMYVAGRGVPQDYVAALKWSRLSAEQGLAIAQGLLGGMYMTGRGVPQDDAEAVRWYRKVAEQGLAAGQYALGGMYAYGLGVPRDYVEAHKWFNIAAARGSPSAAAERDILAGKMTNTQVAEAQRRARAWRPKQQVAATSPYPDSGDASGNRGRIARIQGWLAYLGYDPGPADGIFGSRTRAAIRAFQAQAGLPVTGAISAGLETALRSASRAVASDSGPAPRSFTLEEAVGAPPVPRSLEKTSTGSGFFVSDQGYLLTNEHVVNGCVEVRIAPSLAATVVARDKASDLALLKSPAGKVAAAAKFRQGRGIRPGDDIVVIGYPLRGLLASEANVTTGTVSALAGPGDNRRFIQITAPVQPGNSGGPLLDLAANIVGVVVGKLDAIKVANLTGDIPQNVNFAVSGWAARAFLDSHDVPYETAPSEPRLSASDVAAQARAYTVLVECWK